MDCNKDDKTLIGIVAPVPKGNWSPTIMYNYLNIVNHGAFCLMAKKKNVGIEPGVSAGWEDYWMVLVDLSDLDIGGVKIPEKTSQLENDGNGESPFATQQYVDNEIATFDFIKIVQELPEVGLPNRFYFVPKTQATDNDLFDEYVWADGKWEFLGTRSIEIDLDGYIKNTVEYTAGYARFGTVAIYPGGIYGIDYLYGAVLPTPQASCLKITRALLPELRAGTDIYKAIVPCNMYEAVKQALAYNKQGKGYASILGDPWTEEETENARKLLRCATIADDGSLVIGNTTITEEQFKQLIALIPQ